MPSCSYNSIKQSQLNNVIANYNPLSMGSIAELLTNNGFSTSLKDVTIDSSLFAYSTGLNFKGIDFSNVSFKGDFNKASFKGNFDKCNINADFASAKFVDSSFSNSVLLKSDFSNATYTNVSWNQSVALHSNFADAYFTNNTFTHSILGGNNFKKCSTQDVSTTETYALENLYNTQAVKFKPIASENYLQVTPKTGILNYSQWHDNAYYNMKHQGADVKSIYPAYSIVDTHLLKQEVDEVLADIQLNGLNHPSIPQAILASGKESINAFKAYAKTIVDSIEGFWIPGSAMNVNPKFYGDTLSPLASSYSIQEFYNKEIFEFALIEEVLNQGKALMGVCHGMQIVNVYLGGTIQQHGHSQWGEVRLTQVEDKGLLGSSVKGVILGSSAHNQAVKKLADNLDLVFTSNGVIKGAQANDGSKVMVTQFHPENRASYVNNNNIIAKFVTLSNENNINAKALGLADVLSIDNNFLQSCLDKLNNNASTSHVNESLASNNTLGGAHPDIVINLDDIWSYYDYATLSFAA